MGSILSAVRYDQSPYPFDATERAQQRLQYRTNIQDNLTHPEQPEGGQQGKRGKKLGGVQNWLEAECRGLMYPLGMR